MPKGTTSRPTNRATKKVQRRRMNKEIKERGGDAAYFSQYEASGGDRGSLAQKQQSAREYGSAYDKFVSRMITNKNSPGKPPRRGGKRKGKK